jgi:hypothetical protein
MKSGIVGGAIGSLIGLMLGAAAFMGGTPVDARFTYQGQIRDGDALVSGTADIRFSLWDSLDGGSMVGSMVTKTNLAVTDGRFATELDFGTSAFSGDARWIQMEFRAPAGAGQYTTLAPRQRVNAVPYALYSLNGGLSPWNLDVASRDIGYVSGRVGIGTNSPSGVLEVVSTTGGDDSVKLPPGSIGASEISGTLSYGTAFNFPSANMSKRIYVPKAALLLITVIAIDRNGNGSGFGMSIDGTSVAISTSSNVGCGSYTMGYSGVARVPVSAGYHDVLGYLANTNSGCSVAGLCSMTIVNDLEVP